MWNLSSSFEELDIKRLYDLRAAGRKSSSLSKSYEELLKVITCTMAKLNIVQPDKRRETTDLWATKQMARTICFSMAALVATERQLWLNLSGIKEKERAFRLDTQSRIWPIRRRCKHSHL